MKLIPGLVVVLLASTGLAPAQAGTDGEPRTVTVRADCAGGGTVALRHTTDGGSTHVVVRGAGLHNGGWTGSHLLEVGVDDTEDTALAVPVRHHRFVADLVVEDTGKAGVLDLRHGRDRCLASFDERPRGTIMGSATDSIALWHPDAHRFIARGQVQCRPGSRWSIHVGVGFPDWGFGSGSKPHACGRSGFLRFKQESGTGDPTGAPVTLTFRGRNLDTGAVRRLSYRASSPAS